MPIEDPVSNLRFAGFTWKSADIAELTLLIRALIRANLIEVGGGDGGGVFNGALGPSVEVPFSQVTGISREVELLDRSNHTGVEPIAAIFDTARGQLLSVTLDQIFAALVPADPDAPENTVAPTQQGNTTLTGNITVDSNGTWTGTAVDHYEYRWLRNSQVVAGNTTSTYAKTANDSQAVIALQVRGVSAPPLSLASDWITVSNPFTLDTLAATPYTSVGTPRTIDSEIVSLNITEAGDYLLIADQYLTSGAPVGKVSYSTLASNSWGVPVSMYNQAGLPNQTDVRFTGAAWSSVGELIAIIASKNGIGPGWTICWERTSLIHEESQNMTGTFSSAGTGDIPVAISLSANGLTMAIVFGGTLNQLWTYDGNWGALIPSSAPVALISPLARGNSLKLKRDGLQVMVVSNNRARFLSRSAPGVAWSLLQDFVPLSGTIVGATLNRAFTRFAVATSTLDMYSGSPNNWTLEQRIANPGGGVTLFGQCMAFKEDGTLFVASGKTTTDVTDGTATGSPKQHTIYNWSHA